MKPMTVLSKTDDSLIVESHRLSGANPLAVFKTLRNHFQVKDCTLFRISDPSADPVTGLQNGGFTPSLTILGFDPAQYLQSQNGVTTLRSDLRSGSSVDSSAQDPFEVLQKELKKRKTPSLPGLPFFQGGAMGYMSYDSVRFLEKKLDQKPRVESVPAPHDAEFIFFRSCLVFDHRNQKTYLIQTQKPNLAEVEALELSAGQASAIQPTQLNLDLQIPVDQMKSMLGKDAFVKGVLKLKEHILAGDIFQAVLSDRFTKPFSGSPLKLFEVLSEISPAPYQFYFEIEERSYLGASPEMLVKVSGKEIETHPIAGTRPRGKTPAEELEQEKELMACEKEKAEHLMLVDLARNDVGRVSSPGTVAVNTFMKIRKFSGVMHLVSVVKGKLSTELNSVNALASCFPAGTLSGAPKIRAMELIAEIEGTRRGFYGGAFLAASVTGDLDSCITIRGISVVNGLATIQVGAGIVADSVPEMEYSEIQHKSSMTRKALAITEGL